MMDSIGDVDIDNIDFIIERVKLLLKDLFTVHVELAIEAKKWKKKYQKLTKCNETTKSPPFFDVSNQSCDSSSLSISATIKDLITFSRKDKKNANKQNLSVEHFSAGTKSSNKSPCFKKSTRVSRLLFETKKDKIYLTPSPCKPSASKRSYQIMSGDKQSSITILQENKTSDIFYKDLPSDSERDFESPKPFVPSWKRELIGPPLTVPDTEPIDYEHYKTSTPDVNPKQNINIKQELAMKDTISLHEKHDFKSNPSPEKQTNKEEHLANFLEKNRKKTVENVEVECYFAKSELESLVAENLKEFISPSPDKKKPHTSCKAEKKQMPPANIRKTRSKINSQSSHGDIFSFLDQSPIKNTSANIDQRSENKTRMAKSSYHGGKSKIERDVPTKTAANNTPKQVGDHLEGQGNGGTPGESSFDPDETYCPILREKELLDNKNKHFSPLNNASMIPGLRLSQYFTMDPDQTFDPNSINKNAALVTSANLSQIRTPSPLSQGQMSQELISLDGIDDILLPKSINNSMPHSSNMKFAVMKAHLDDEDLSLEDGKDGNCFDGFKRPAYLNDSFDRVPAKKNTSPKYAHVDVVRKKCERNKLDAFACEQCKKWYDTVGLSEEERKERMKSCRHRSKYQPTSTPEHYWSIGFPDTEVCKKRGYIEVEDEENALAVTRARRKRAYRKIF